MSTPLTIYMYSNKLAMNIGIRRMMCVSEDGKGLFGFCLGTRRQLTHAECEQIFLRTYPEQGDQERAKIRVYFRKNGFEI
jgi:hypothetical protein